MLYKRNMEELLRKECDSEMAYTTKEIYLGEVILKDEECGFWQSNFSEFYANPLFVKLCRKLWQHFPEFLIVGEE